MDGRRVHTDMEMWTEIRRKVLVEGASKRSIRRDYRISARTLEKMLANAQPPGYRQGITRPTPMLGQFLGVIDEILDADKTAPVGCKCRIRPLTRDAVNVPRSPLWAVRSRSCSFESCFDSLASVRPQMRRTSRSRYSAISSASFVAK